MQALTCPIRCIQLSIYDRMCGCLAHVAHPDFSGLDVGGVDDELFGVGVIGGSGSHGLGVAAMTELCQCEAAI